MVPDKTNKVQHIPKIMRWALLKPTVTFQLYRGVLLGSNLNIQMVLYNWEVGGWSKTHLQNVQEMMPLNLREIMVECQSFLEEILITRYFM